MGLPEDAKSISAKGELAISSSKDLVDAGIRRSYSATDRTTTESFPRTVTLCGRVWARRTTSLNCAFASCNCQECGLEADDLREDFILTSQSSQILMFVKKCLKLDFSLLNLSLLIKRP